MTGQGAEYFQALSTLALLAEIVSSLLELQSLAENTASWSPIVMASAPEEEVQKEQNTIAMNTPGTQPPGPASGIQNLPQYSPTGRLPTSN